MDEQNNTNESPKTEEVKKLEAPDKINLIAILAYLNILIIIPFLVAKDNVFVKFHIKQGLVLFTLSLIVWVLNMSMTPFVFFGGLINLFVLVLSIIGIINVVQDKEKELPLVGQFSKYFNF